MTKLAKILKKEKVRFIRVVWTDNANVMRAKSMHIDAALKGDLDFGVGISPAQQAVPVTVDAFVAESGLGPVGEIRLLPDWNTMTVLPYAPGHARVYGDMFDGENPWEHCPRDFLKRMVDRCQEQGLHLETAFENEFYLFDRETGQPFDQTLFCQVQAYQHSLPFLTRLEEVLAAQQIPVVSYYPESGSGQQEVAVMHAPPLETADRQLAFRETVHAVAHQQGLKACFLPKPLPNMAGSGCHLHLSLWRDGQNLGMSEEVRWFWGGLLHHLPSLMAITTPIPNSYQRLGPHLWSGAFTCWGYDNREAAVRVLRDPAGGPPKHFELKTVDASSNPYLVLGAVIAAGLDGIEQQMDPGEAVEVDPGLLDPAERESRKIARLPQKWEQALRHLENNPRLEEAMGKALFRSFLSVRRKECGDLDALEDPEQIKMLTERY